MKSSPISQGNSLIYYKFAIPQLHRPFQHHTVAAPGMPPPQLRASAVHAISTCIPSVPACIAHDVPHYGTMAGSIPGRNNTAYTGKNSIHIFGIQ
jgi:hypothetical protein